MQQGLLPEAAKSGFLVLQVATKRNEKFQETRHDLVEEAFAFGSSGDLVSSILVSSWYQVS